jgi:hypothetical protein
MCMHDKLGLLSVVALASGCATSSLDLAPAAPNAPWIPATRADGEIVAGAPASATAPASRSYVLPSNARAAGETRALEDLDESHSYALAELIDLAESHDPSTRVAWAKRARCRACHRNRQDGLPSQPVGQRSRGLPDGSRQRDGGRTRRSVAMSPCTDRSPPCRFYGCCSILANARQ